MLCRLVNRRRGSPYSWPLLLNTHLPTKVYCDIPLSLQAYKQWLTRNSADGVVYLELRTTPRSFPKEGLDKKGYVDTVLAAIDAAQQKFPSIQVRLILSIG